MCPHQSVIISKFFYGNVYCQEPVTFTAENESDDVAQIFIDTLEENIKDIYKFKFQQKMVFTAADAKEYDAASVYHVGEQPFDSNDKNKIKVRNHCHLSGRFRGAAHKDCNLNYKIPDIFPVIFHCLSG
jgi:hypothetical protein